jgi:hypothetical protein
MELRELPAASARGVVVESFIDKKIGVLATVLVQAGQLNVGDVMLTESCFGRVKRILFHGAADDMDGPTVGRGTRAADARLTQDTDIRIAGPSMPVQASLKLPFTFSFNLRPFRGIHIASAWRK